MNDLNINITTNSNCKIVIQDNTEYPKKGFKYSDSVSIVVLLQNKVKETIVKAPTYNYHKNSLIEVPIEFDGWFTMNYIVLPTKEWFQATYDKIGDKISDVYSIVYFVDDRNIYKYVNGNIESASIEELLEINSESTTILKTSLEYISICFLQKCYINLCLLIFNNRGFSKCWNKNNSDDELSYKRDLVWMAINVIKYLTEFNLLLEVERIIELVNGCNGLCKTDSTYLSTSSGCGCSR